jgi:hypothetical protein
MILAKLAAGQSALVLLMLSVRIDPDPVILCTKMGRVVYTIGACRRAQATGTSAMAENSRQSRF